MESPKLRPAVDRALAAAQLEPRDQAAAALARRYASMADDHPETLPDVGPKLLAVLSALGCTLAGRGVKGKGGGEDAAAVVDPLDELRARRDRRAGGAG